MTSTPGGGKKVAASKKGGKSESSFETYPPPTLDPSQLTHLILNELALNNDYQTLCGAYDTKDHPLTVYIHQEDLFNKRLSLFSMRTPLELACIVGNGQFLAKLLERADKLLPSVDMSDLLKQSNTQGYTLLHYACVWGHFDLCKMLVFNAAVGGFLLKSKTLNDETPKKVAHRYSHSQLVSFLDFAELRQELVERIVTMKETCVNDARFNKDEKKKMEKLCVDFLDWLEKSKVSDIYDVNTLKVKSIEINDTFKPYHEKLNSTNITPIK